MVDIEKVKRGLAYCADGCSTDCPYANGCRCGKNLSIDSMTVIEELQAEIKRLQPKKGHWEMKEDPFGLFDEIPVCSECGRTNTLRKKTAFCEHCGADMKEGDGE